MRSILRLLSCFAELLREHFFRPSKKPCPYEFYKDGKYK